MAYQIDIDVNSDQLELLNEALDTTFNSFRSAIDKLDKSILADSKLRQLTDKKVSGYSEVKNIVLNEDVILKQFEKSGSVKFLSDTLNRVASTLISMSSLSKSQGAAIAIDARFIDAIKSLETTLKSIDTEKLSTANQSLRTPSKIVYSDETLSTEANEKITLDIKQAISERIKALKLYDSEMEKFSELNNANFKNYEKNVRALIATAELFKKVGDKTLLANAISDTEVYTLAQNFDRITKKRVPKIDALMSTDERIYQAIGDKALPKSAIENIVARAFSNVKIEKLESAVDGINEAILSVNFDGLENALDDFQDKIKETVEKTNQIFEGESQAVDRTYKKRDRVYRAGEQQEEVQQPAKFLDTEVIKSAKVASQNLKTLIEFANSLQIPDWWKGKPSMTQAKEPVKAEPIPAQKLLAPAKEKDYEIDSQLEKKSRKDSNLYRVEKEELPALKIFNSQLLATSVILRDNMKALMEFKYSLETPDWWSMKTPQPSLETTISEIIEPLQKLLAPGVIKDFEYDTSGEFTKNRGQIYKSEIDRNYDEFEVQPRKLFFDELLKNTLILKANKDALMQFKRALEIPDWWLQKTPAREEVKPILNAPNVQRLLPGIPDEGFQLDFGVPSRKSGLYKSEERQNELFEVRRNQKIFNDSLLISAEIIKNNAKALDEFRIKLQTPNWWDMKSPQTDAIDVKAITESVVAQKLLAPAKEKDFVIDEGQLKSQANGIYKKELEAKEPIRLFNQELLNNAVSLKNNIAALNQFRISLQVPDWWETSKQKAEPFPLVATEVAPTQKLLAAAKEALVTIDSSIDISKKQGMYQSQNQKPPIPENYFNGLISKTEKLENNLRKVNELVLSSQIPDWWNKPFDSTPTPVKPLEAKIEVQKLLPPGKMEEIQAPIAEKRSIFGDIKQFIDRNKPQAIETANEVKKFVQFATPIVVNSSLAAASEIKKFAVFATPKIIDAVVVGTPKVIDATVTSVKEVKRFVDAVTPIVKGSVDIVVEDVKRLTEAAKPHLISAGDEIKRLTGSIYQSVVSQPRELGGGIAEAKSVYPQKLLAPGLPLPTIEMIAAAIKRLPNIEPKLSQIEPQKLLAPAAYISPEIFRKEIEKLIQSKRPEKEQDRPQALLPAGKDYKLLPPAKEREIYQLLSTVEDIFQSNLNKELQLLINHEAALRDILYSSQIPDVWKNAFQTPLEKTEFSNPIAEQLALPPGIRGGDIELYKGFQTAIIKFTSSFYSLISELEIAKQKLTLSGSNEPKLITGIDPIKNLLTGKEQTKNILTGQSEPLFLSGVKETALLLSGLKTLASLPPGNKGGDLAIREPAGEITPLVVALVKLEATISALATIIQKILPGTSQKSLKGSPAYDFDVVAFPPVPSEHNPFVVARKRIELLTTSMDVWVQKSLPGVVLPPLPSSHNPFIQFPEEIKQLIGDSARWTQKALPSVAMPPAPTSFNPFIEIPRRIEELRDDVIEEVQVLMEFFPNIGESKPMPPGIEKLFPPDPVLRDDEKYNQEWGDYYDALIAGKEAVRPPTIPEPVRFFSNINPNTTFLEKVVEKQWIPFATAINSAIENVKLPTPPVGKIDSLFDDTDFADTTGIVSAFEDVIDEISAIDPLGKIEETIAQQKTVIQQSLPPVPSLFNPYGQNNKPRYRPLPPSFIIPDPWMGVDATPPKAESIKALIGHFNKMKLLVGSWQNVAEKVVTGDIMPPVPSSHNPFHKIGKFIQELKKQIGWWDIEGVAIPPAPTTHNPFKTTKKLVGGILQELPPSQTGATPPPPPPPRKPPTPPFPEPSGEEPDGRRRKTDAAMFEEARQKLAALKDRLLREGVGNIGSYRATMTDLFGDNKPKNEEKAQLLVSSANRWIEKQIKIFENASLADAKVAAKLGDKSAFASLSSDDTIQQRKIALARQEAEKAEQRRDKGFLSQAKKEESESFSAYRRQLEARLKAAMSDTTDNQVALIQQAVAAIKRAKEYIQSNESQFFDKERFGKDGVEVYNLQNLENRGLKKIENIQNNRDNRIETTSLQEMRAGLASIRTFIQDLQTFTNGLIQVSSAMSKEVVKLSVANNNSIVKTDKDIADSTALAKKFGGSVSSYLKDLANIKVADLSQITQSGSLTPNRFLDSEVKSLVSGLRSAYNVNQLDREAQDGASKAVAQMLSKGKIQAEELRGQLGDRLNGAVTLFAQALGISTAQLDRRLKEGSIMDVEVFKFGRLLERKYAEAAQAPTLIKETTSLSGAAQDIATQATQPVAGVATVAAQFLNSLTDGIKANAASTTVAMLPVGLALAGGISKSVKEAFLSSSFSSPIISGLGESLRANAKTLGVLGGGLGVAAIGSSLLGTDGLDKTILKLGDQIKALVGVFGNFIGGLKEKSTESGIGKSVPAKLAFEVLPLAALVSPVTNYAIDKVKEISEKQKLEAVENDKKLKAEGRKATFGEKASSIASGIPFANVGAAVLTAVVGYSVANTKFISEYAEVTDRMVKELRKGKGDKPTAEQKKETFRKNEGTDQPITLDTPSIVIRDIIANATNDFKSMSVAALEKVANSSNYSERREAARAALDEKLQQGYTPTSSYAGGAAADQIVRENDATNRLLDEIQSRFSPSYYASEIQKATPILNQYKQESQTLLAMQNSGTSSQTDIDAQNVKVQTLAVKLREVTPDLINAQSDVAQRINELEGQKERILTQDLAGAKERAAFIDSELAKVRAYLPKFSNFIQSLSDPNQTISDRKAEISTREKKIAIERIQDSTGISFEREKSLATRFTERNDDLMNLRESATGIKAAQQNLIKLEEQARLATERKNLISQQTSSEGQQQEYETALKAEAEALNQLQEGVLGLTKARLDEKKAIEDYLLSNYARTLRNFSAADENTNYFDSKKGLQKGILTDTVEFGTLGKAQFALDEYLKILPSLNLNADDVKEKLRELSDQVALSTLSFIEQRTTFQSAKTIAQIDSATPNAPLRDTFFDRISSLQRSLQKTQIEQDNTAYLTSKTREALGKVQDPTEKSNLALKLINLETEAIKRKFDVEMAGIEIARAAYKRNMDVFQTLLNSGTNFAQSNSQNRQFVEGRKLEDRFAQTNQFGATLTENRQALERLNNAISVQNQNRATNRSAQLGAENLFSQMVPDLPPEYKQFLTKRLAQSSAFQVNTDLNDLQTQIDLANNSSTPVDMIQTKNLGQINIQVAEALVKLLAATAQIKQIDQGNSEAVAQARNAYNLSTAAVVRAKRQQDASNKLAGLETTVEAEGNQGQIRVAIANAKSQADAIRARNSGTNQTLNSILTAAEAEYLEQIRKAEAAIKIAEATRASLKKTQDEMAFGATQVELDANAAILRGEDEKIRKLRVQLRGTQIAGAEKLISTVAGFTSDLNGLFDTASNKLKESVDLINRNLNIFRGVGLEGLKNPAIYDTIPVAYTDKNGVVRQREEQSKVLYDPNTPGDYETAQLITEINKVQAEAKTKIALLEYVQKNLPKIQAGGVEGTQQYQDVPELRPALKEIESLILGTQSLTEATNILNTAMENLKNSMFTDAERAEIPNRKLTRDRNTEIINRSDLEINRYQAQEKRLSSDRGTTDILRLLIGLEPALEEIKAQRRKAEAEFNISQLSSSRFDREKGQSLFKERILELDDQMNKLPVYGNRLASAMEDAVANGSKLSAVLSEAITKGDWSNVLQSILSNIALSLGDKFGNDAAKGLGGLLGGGLQSLLGLPAKSSGDLPSYNMGTLPSYGMGTLPCYADGTLPDGVVGKRGRNYPRTRSQDPRELSTSHLAIIGRDELVVPAAEVSTYIDFKRGINASSNVNTTSNTNTNANTYNSYSYSNYQGDKKDSFSRPEVYRTMEEQSRMNRFS